MERERGNGQSRMTEAVLHNPVPLALLGLGLGWLMVSSVREGWSGGEEEESERLGYGSEPYGGYGGATGYSTAAGYGGSGYEAAGGMRERRGRMQHASRRASEMAGEVRQRAEKATTQAREQMTEVGQRVSEMGQKVRYQASDLADRSWQMFQDHPLMIGSMAVLVGAAIGAAFPRSQAEGRFMGGARDDLLRSAAETGRETFEKAKRVASRAADVAREEGASALERVRDAARDEAERENLTQDTSSTRFQH